MTERKSETINWDRVENATKNLYNVVKQRQEGLLTWLKTVFILYEQLKFQIEGK